MQRFGIVVCGLLVLRVLSGSASAAWPDFFDPRYVDAYNDTVHQYDNPPSAKGYTDHLTTITPTSPGLIWKNDVPGSQVLMSCFTDFPAYNRQYAEDLASPYYAQTPKTRREIWSAVAPQLYNFLRDNHVRSEDAALRTKQLLGMPASHTGNRVVEFWVSPDSLFRPMMDPSLSRSDSALVYPPDFTQYTTRYQNYWYTFKQWREHEFDTYKTVGNVPYPWSDLGYTYDWGSPNNHVGLTEFITKYNDHTNASPSLWIDNPIEVLAVVSIGSYPYYDRAGNFNVTGNCDTIWAGDLYTPVSLLGNTINIAAGATVYEGITVSSGGFSIANAGTILGPGRNLDNSFRDSAVQFQAGGRLTNPGTISGSQVGVSVEAGDSQIDNSGVIRGSNYAIRTGNGADQITNTGLIDGRILTGGGNDTLTIRGGAVTGDIDGGTGVNTLSFDPGTGQTFVYNAHILNFQDVLLASGTVRLNGQVSGQMVTVPSGVTLGGNGTYLGGVTNNGIVSPGNGLGSIGDIRIQGDPQQQIPGDYLQNSGSVLQIDVTKPFEAVFSADRLIVARNATLDANSTIQVNYVSGAQSVFRTGDLFTIVSAGGSLPQNISPRIECYSRFLTFAGYTPWYNTQAWQTIKLFQLQANRTATFASVSPAPNRWSLANALDKDSDTAQGGFASLVNELLFMNEPQFQQALPQLGLAPYHAVNTSALRTAQYLADDMAAYLHTRREGRVVPSATSTQLSADSSMTPVAADARYPSTLTNRVLEEASVLQEPPIVRQQSADRQTLGFVKPFGLFFGERSRGDLIGFRANSPGVLVGVDREVDDGSILGLQIGYANSDIRFLENRGWGDVDLLRVGPYWSTYRDDWFLDCSATWGHYDHNIHRSVVVGSLQETAHGKYQANDVSLYLGGGVDLATASEIVTPTASLQYTYFGQSPFTETGAPGADLAVSANDVYSLRSKLGAQLTRSFCWKGVKIAREAFGGWAHEYLADQTLTARFAAGLTPFSFEPLGLFRDSGYFGAGLAAMPRENVTLFLRYHGELSSGADFHSCNLGLGVQY